MSLFQTKEWWSTRVSGSDEFDERHLCIANIDNNSRNVDRIIVGSFAGFLRIYEPKRGEFTPQNLLLEQNFNEPIIQVTHKLKEYAFIYNINQVSCGYYSSAPNILLLAVLFFKRLCIFECESLTDSRIGLKRSYVCNLSRNAYNMCQGPFGGAQKDLICIQSCDGMLMIVESDQITAGVQLQDFLLPSPITYNQATDQIIIQNSSNEMEGFKISNIGAVSNSSGTKKLSSDWNLNIGEQCIKLVTVCRDNKLFDIIALTEEAIFVITQTGQIRAQKRFEYPAANFIVNEIPEKYSKCVQDQLSGQPLRVLSLIISSFTGHMMIYEDFQLLWATKYLFLENQFQQILDISLRTDHICHGIGVGTFDNQRGLLIGMNDDGWLDVSYLGTQLPQNQLAIFSPPINSDLNINQLSDLYDQTVKKVNQIESKKPTKRPEANEKMNINVQISGPIPAYDYVQNDNQYYCFEKGEVKCAKVRINLSYTGVRATNVQVQLMLPPNLECPSNKIPHYVEEITKDYTFEFPIYVLKKYTPSMSSVEICVTYHNSTPGSKQQLTPKSVHNYFYLQLEQSNKDPRNSVSRIDLPCALQCHLVVPIKNTNFKINLNTDLPCENVAEVFKDVIEKCPNKSECFVAPNVFTFEYPNGEHASILSSKQGDKYRIQSSSFDGIYFIMSNFFDKLTSYQEQTLLKTNIKEKKVADITFTEVVTFQDLFTEVDSHYLMRHKLQDIKLSLEKKASEFRTIQKRLLTRFKEKNPAPINNLDILMQKSFEDLIQLGNNYERILEGLTLKSNNLSITVKLILRLFKIRFNLSEEIMSQLEQAISSEITGDEEEIGWEEITNANIIYLLKVVMKKEMKDNHVNIEKIEDFSKFKKHLTFVFDKIAKGQLSSKD